MDADASRRLMRQVIKRVHPDLFSEYPEQRARNSESLKALNAYVEALSRGHAPGAMRLEFWVRSGSVSGASASTSSGGYDDGGGYAGYDDDLQYVPAELPAAGALEPLFYAFGLITADELAAGLSGATSRARGGAGARGAVDTDFLQWLRATVDDAVALAGRHEDMKLRIREERAAIEHRHALASLQAGSEFSASPAEQARQLEALRVLGAALDALAADGLAAEFAGLHVHAYHPDAPPIAPGMSDGGGGGMMMGGSGSTAAAGFVADDGCLHVVADRHGLRELLLSLDLPRARVLARVTAFWLKRARDLAPALVALLGVQNVWCDTRSEANAQNFVIWAGYVLEQRDGVAAAVGGRQFAFSVLVHSDPASPMLDYSPKSSILQVRSDTPPRAVVEFLLGEGSSAADAAAAAVAAGAAEEAALLESVRAAFGAKHVVRVCGAPGDGAAVLDGARRLLAAADAIRRSGVDLAGASLAIDDCYEVWGSGFISIPYDFELSDLAPNLTRLLGSGAAAGGAGGGGGSIGDVSSSSSSDGAAAGADSMGGGGGGAQPRQHNTVAAAVAAQRMQWRRCGSGQGAAAAVVAPAFKRPVPLDPLRPQRGAAARAAPLAALARSSRATVSTARGCATAAAGGLRTPFH